MSLTEQEIVRYSRHIILPEVGGRGQRKLKAASVLLAGLGAAGSAAALYLAAAGIGQITLWDPLVVTPQDLASGIAHDRSRIGLPRARSAAVPMRAINPDAQIDVLDRESDVLGAVAAHQLVLASAGDWEALTNAAYKSGAATVLYGAHGASGAAAAFRQGQPCLRCLGAERAQNAGLFPEAGGAPAIAAAAGVVGVVAATEAVKLILGTGEPLFGRVLSYDGWRAAFREESF
ncbi:MAG: molybdopterin biosynthesis protein, partial [Firmicutes bacterium]|nr:molybdopterin biosynthesis protein [Bacillota bacterium]